MDISTVTAVILSFMNPDGSAVVANSSQLYASPRHYESIEACDNAPLPSFVSSANGTDSEFNFTGVKACFSTVPEDKAGAWLAIWKASQNTGLRFQNDGQIVFLPVADAATCEQYVNMLQNVQPVWETDLPLNIAGGCI